MTQQHQFDCNRCCIHCGMPLVIAMRFISSKCDDEGAARAKWEQAYAEPPTTIEAWGRGSIVQVDVSGVTQWTC